MRSKAKKARNKLKAKGVEDDSSGHCCWIVRVQVEFIGTHVPTVSETASTDGLQTPWEHQRHKPEHQLQPLAMDEYVAWQIEQLLVPLHGSNLWSVHRNCSIGWLTKHRADLWLCPLRIQFVSPVLGRTLELRTIKVNPDCTIRKSVCPRSGSGSSSERTTIQLRILFYKFHLQPAPS